LIFIDLNFYILLVSDSLSVSLSSLIQIQLVDPMRSS